MKRKTISLPCLDALSPTLESTALKLSLIHILEPFFLQQNFAFFRENHCKNRPAGRQGTKRRRWSRGSAGLCYYCLLYTSGPPVCRRGPAAANKKAIVSDC